MKNRICFIWILVIVAGFFLAVPEAFCKTKTGPATLLTRADKCRNVLLKSSKKMKYRHNWLKCIGLYKRVYKVYPKRNQAVWALYHSANLYTGLYRYSGQSKDLNKALTLYRGLAGKHKSHSLADDAQYKVGEIYYKFRKDPAQAYVEFLKVEVNFPSETCGPRPRRCSPDFP